MECLAQKVNHLTRSRLIITSIHPEPAEITQIVRGYQFLSCLVECTYNRRSTLHQVWHHKWILIITVLPNAKTKWPISKLGSNKLTVKKSTAISSNANNIILHFPAVQFLELVTPRSYCPEKKKEVVNQRVRADLMDYSQDWRGCLLPRYLIDFQYAVLPMSSGSSQGTPTCLILHRHHEFNGCCQCGSQCDFLCSVTLFFNVGYIHLTLLTCKPQRHDLLCDRGPLSYG